MKNQEIEENNKYRQGRSKQKQQDNEMMTAWAFGGLVVIMLGMIFYNLFRAF